jgi:hypothetical protein
MVGTRGMVGHASRAGISYVLVCGGGVRVFGHYFARPGGGCVLKGTVWTPVGCVGGQGTVQVNSLCVLIRRRGSMDAWAAKVPYRIILGVY